jgi:hypothetical protein
MLRRRNWFQIWLAILTAAWVVANWPRAYLGSLKSFLVCAGQPWQFAEWEHGRLNWFDLGALSADISFGVVGIVSIAWLCGWSRGKDAPDHHRSQFGQVSKAMMYTGKMRRLSHNMVVWVQLRHLPTVSSTANDLSGNRCCI